jgi:intracellular sulfur oxidation DsrE/DsrF family protein
MKKTTLAALLLAFITTGLAACNDTATPSSNDTQQKHATSQAERAPSVDNGFRLTNTPEVPTQNTDRFPGDPAEHKIVFMFNKDDPAYQHAILNSIKALIELYQDNVEIAVVAIGPGLHVLTKDPLKPVNQENYDRIGAFATDDTIRVRFIACGNTMNTLHLLHQDMRPFAEYSRVGAAALMGLQEQGFKFIAW